YKFSNIGLGSTKIIDPTAAFLTVDSSSTSNIVFSLNDMDARHLQNSIYSFLDGHNEIVPATTRSARFGSATTNPNYAQLALGDNTPTVTDNTDAGTGAGDYGVFSSTATTWTVTTDLAGTIPAPATEVTMSPSGASFDGTATFTAASQGKTYYIQGGSAIHKKVTVYNLTIALKAGETPPLSGGAAHYFVVQNNGSDITSGVTFETKLATDPDSAYATAASSYSAGWPVTIPLPATNSNYVVRATINSMKVVSTPIAVLAAVATITGGTISNIQYTNVPLTTYTDYITWADAVSPDAPSKPAGSKFGAMTQVGITGSVGNSGWSHTFNLPSGNGKSFTLGSVATAGTYTQVVGNIGKLTPQTLEIYTNDWFGSHHIEVTTGTASYNSGVISAGNCVRHRISMIVTAAAVDAPVQIRVVGDGDSSHSVLLSAIAIKP
ncbi:MAG: hypothetical protein WCJ56_04830, partial [bacterium]